MKHIEIPAVGYGDCTVFIGNNRNLLMVDCGSMNNKLRDPELDITGVFSFIGERYRSYTVRSFLLTHYHRDHLCGFTHLIKKDPGYFSRVYLPYIPNDTDGRNPVIELAAYSFILSVPQTDLAQINTACLTLPLNLSNSIGHENVFILREGSSFLFDGEIYDVLNPAVTTCYDKVLYEKLQALEEKFPQLAGSVQAFTEAYSKMQENLNPTGLDKLTEELEKLKELRGIYSADYVFGDQSFMRTYSAAVNNESVVFHNRAVSSRSILMTGDISGERLETLSPSLRSHYYAVKAPHHGTAGGFSPVLNELDIEHIIISNEEYKDELTVTSAYTQLDAMKHCTSCLSCEYFKEHGGCCNRLNFCYNFPGGPGLGIKCPAASKTNKIPYCGIYVVTPAKGRSCFCD